MGPFHNGPLAGRLAVAAHPADRLPARLSLSVRLPASSEDPFP